MADSNNSDLPPTGGSDDNTMKIAVLGHLMRLEREQTTKTLEAMASLLEAAVPDRVIVTRSGWFLSKVKPVERLEIILGDAGYDIVKSKHGAPVATHRKIVGGIVLKSTPVTMERCITDIVDRLTALESSSAATRIALQNFVQGR